MSDEVASGPCPLLTPNEQVYHPRLGIGRVLRLRQDGSVVVQFDGQSRPDVLFPFLLVRGERESASPYPGHCVDSSVSESVPDFSHGEA